MPDATAPFESFGSPLQCLPAIAAVLARDGAALPELIRDKVSAGLGAGGVEPILTAMEGLYAAREDLSADSLTQLGQIAQVVAANGFGEQGKSGRATAIVQAVRRDRGEAGSFPEPAADPETDAAFLPPPPPEDNSEADPE